MYPARLSGNQCDLGTGLQVCAGPPLARGEDWKSREPGHGEGLDRAGDAEQHLVLLARRQPAINSPIARG